jgi:hypothetical protein
MAERGDIVRAKRLGYKHDMDVLSNDDYDPYDYEDDDVEGEYDELVLNDTGLVPTYINYIVAGQVVDSETIEVVTPASQLASAAFHLPGKHDQKAHGRSSKITSDDWNKEAGLKKLSGYKDSDQFPASEVGIKDLFDNVSGEDAKVPPSVMRRIGEPENIDLTARELLSHQSTASVSRLRHYVEHGLPDVGDEKLPRLTILPSGKVVIKDGNHRVIASLLAERTTIRANVNHVTE